MSETPSPNPASAPTTAAGVPRRRVSLLRSTDWQAVVVVLLLKALVLGYAVLALRTLMMSEHGWARMWNRWDAVHYVQLAENGYVSTGEQRFSIVFYPLYPWLTRAFAFLTHDYVAAAFVVSGLASVAAGILLQRLARLDHPPAVARLAVWFLFIFPTSYFLHIGYTESLFLALTLGCLLAARREHWLTAGVLGGLASLTRINGLLIAPVLVIEAWEQYRVRRRIDLRWLSIVLVIAGFGAYLLLNYRVTGDPLTFLVYQREHWFKALTPPWLGLDDLWRRVLGSNLTEGFHELFFVVLTFLCTIWCWFRLRLSYAVWMTLNWLLFTSTSFVLSVPRYTLTLFPLFILFARLANRRPLFYTLLTAWSLLLLGLFVLKFAEGTWAF